MSLFAKKPLNIYPRGTRLASIPPWYEGVPWDKWRAQCEIEREPRKLELVEPAELKFGRKKTA